MKTNIESAAFVTSGFGNFCQHYGVYLTNVKDVRLIQYKEKPTFKPGKESISSLEQNLAKRRQISTALVLGTSKGSGNKFLEFLQMLKQAAENFFFNNYMQLCQINTAKKLNATALTVFFFYFVSIHF